MSDLFDAPYTESALGEGDDVYVTDDLGRTQRGTITSVTPGADVRLHVYLADGQELVVAEEQVRARAHRWAA